MNDLVQVFNNYYSEIKSTYDLFLKFAEANPVVGGIVGVWGLGIVTLFFKTLPSKIISLFKRYCTVKITFNNRHESFHHLLIWAEKNEKFKNPRTLRVSNGAWGYDDTTTSMGLGFHWVFFRLRPMLFNRYILSSDGDRVKEEIEIQTVGFSQDIFKKLVKDITPKNKKKKKIYVFEGEEWRDTKELPHRHIDSIILKEGQKDRILNFIRDFQDSRQWYLDHGIAHKTGIMLEGPPGTGKTSLIKSLGHSLDVNLCVINCSTVNDKTLDKALSSAPEESIILLEDIDSISATKSREHKSANDIEFFTTLSGILNAIDGVYSSEGRILIATTNCVDKLDNALIRPGRFDLIETLDYVDSDMTNRMFLKFFPDCVANFELCESNRVSAAQLENIFLTNKTNSEKARTEVLRLITNQDARAV